MAVESYPSGDAVLVWAGAITPSGFRVNADVGNTAKALRIVVSTNSDLGSPTFTSAWQVPVVSQGTSVTYATVKLDVTGLLAGTTYYYQIQSFGAPSQTGRIRSLATAPAAGIAAAFRCVMTSCSDLYSNNVPRGGMRKVNALRSIALELPLFYVSLGDLIYAQVDTTDIGRQRERVARMYRTCQEADILHRTVPIAYIPDDHDFGTDAHGDIGLDTSVDAPTIMANTRTVYQETVPHYPLVNSGVLTQVFDIGLTRFIMPDCHSQRSYANLTTLGRAYGSGDNFDQVAWIATVLADAEAAGIKMIFFLSSPTWTGPEPGHPTSVFNGFGDTFTADRKALCDLFEECAIPVCIICGDAHAIAFDDGTNTASSTDGFAFFPQILASALYQNPTPASGPYSWNGTVKYYHPVTSPNVQTQMYVVLDVAADGSWTATAKGSPIDETTFAPTTLGSVTSADVTPAVSFNNAAPTVAHGSPLTVNFDKTWFGACSVHWASSDGQSGNVTFKPNKTRASFAITFVSAGSPTITLSSPSGCTISGTNPATVTVT